MVKQIYIQNKDCHRMSLERKIVLISLLLKENASRRWLRLSVFFAVKRCLRSDIVREWALFCDNPGHCIRSYVCRILIKHVRKTPTWLTVKYGA